MASTERDGLDGAEGVGRDTREGVMTQYQVDSGQVAQASAAVAGSADRIGAEADRMTHHLTELQACWKGPAAASFQQVVTDWRAAQERVRAVLDEIRQALLAASRQYEEAEQTAIRMFTR